MIGGRRMRAAHRPHWFRPPPRSRCLCGCGSQAPLIGDGETTGGATAGRRVHRPRAIAIWSPRTDGSDSNRGHRRIDPLRSPQKLVASLAPGQIGCLRSGLYDGEQQVELATPEITLTSFPGERAEIRGRVWVSDEAPGSTVSKLILDGRNRKGLPSPIVNGDDVTIAGNDITNHHTGICVSIGSADTYGRAQGTLIEGNDIHDCGTAAVDELRSRDLRQFRR